MLSLELEQLQENPSEVQSGARTPKSDDLSFRTICKTGISGCRGRHQELV
jgi:hypothetical protein